MDTLSALRNSAAHGRTPTLKTTRTGFWLPDPATEPLDTRQAAHFAPVWPPGVRWARESTRVTIRPGEPVAYPVGKVLTSRSVARMTRSAEQDLDEAVWLAWQAAADALPEGFRAEIVEGRIEVSARGHARPAGVANRLRRALDAALTGSDFGALQCMYGSRSTS